MATVKYLDENGLSTVWSKVKGIVTPKADKVSGATNGHLAGLNSSGNLTDSGLAASNIAQKDGSYSGMTVGAAEDLVSAESVASEFTSRITGGSTAVGKGGTALVDKIKGRTLVWNQLVKNINTADWSVGGANVTTATFVDGEAIFTVASSGSNRDVRPTTIVNYVTGHKYYIAFEGKSETSLTLYLSSYTANGNGLSGANVSIAMTSAYQRVSGIRTGARDVSGWPRYSISDSAGGTVYLRNPVIIDMTLMFGAGYEPATPEEFEALYPGPHYDHNPGTLINNAAEGVKTVGFNLWDEEWEVGNISSATGQNASSSTLIRSKNSIKMVPGVTQYYIKAPSGVYFRWYDADGNYMPFDTNYTDISRRNEVFAPRTGAAYLRILMAATAYGNDICISVSGASNGTYEPHWESVLELGLGDIKVKSPNIWDEVWVAGTIDTATGIDTTGTAIRSVNYIPVSPGNTYYRKGTVGIREYDAQKNYITYQAQGTDTTFTVSSNCAFIRIISAGSNTYSNNITINLSKPGINGKYFPYGDGGVISITGGLKSAGTVYDEISGGKFIKRIDVEDMTGKAWTRQAYGERYRFYAQCPTPAPSSTENVVCPKYIQNKYVTDGASSAVDKSISIAYDRIYIIDDSYTDTTTFAASLAYVPLYYQLAQPIEYELADAIPTAMRNDPYGTERRLPEDTAGTVLAPFRADITYSTNIKEAVQSLPQNYINVNSIQDFLAALGAQMGGTWTMRPADGKFDFSFTPNPSNE